MRKIKYLFALSAVFVLILGVSSALAQGKPSPPSQNRQGIVDGNGDGICDITGRPIGNGTANGQGPQLKRGNRNGPGDGTGNQRQGPRDGTGYGSKSGRRTGPQDGTAPRVGRPSWSGAGGASAGPQVRRGRGR